MDGDRSPEEPPCLFGREDENRSDQADECIESAVEDSLSGPSPVGEGGVAIHPVLGDIDIKTAQIDGAKLIHPW